MKRRYYPRKVKYVYPRKRWASNIQTLTTMVGIEANQSSGFSSYAICGNSAQNAIPTPVLVKFGRVKIKGDVRTDLDIGNYVSGNMYVVFVPQGVTVHPQLIVQHPEYVMGWTTISLDSGNAFSFSSSLKRNLNSGDSIYVLFTVNSSDTSSQVRAFNFHYTCQYWTTSV